MNIEDLENDIIDWRAEGEVIYADSLENLLNIYLYERNKDLFLKEKEKHLNMFPEFQFPNCFNEEILESPK